MRNKILLFVSFCLILNFTGCSKKEEETKKEEIKSVFVIKPIPEDKNQNRIFNAIATSKDAIKLSFKVQGNLQNFNIEVGDELKKDKVFASLDKEPYEIKVSQIKYGLNEAKAKLALAKSSYERTKKLYINQNASASDIDNAKANLDSSLAQVKNIKKQLDYAKLQLSYTNLISPIDGFVATKYVDKNENVNAGTPIVLLSNKLIDEVHLKVPESIINRIDKDTKVSIDFDSLDNKSFKGKIKEVSKSTSSNEKNYLVIVKVENATKEIKAGMSASVNLNFKNIKNNILLVPSNSVLNDKKGYFVYVLEKQNNKYLIKRKDIEVGELTNDGFQVKKGLKLDDLVLKAGMSEVFEDMQVKIGNQKDLGK